MNIVSIIEKIKNSFPDITIDTDVKINEFFIASYIVSQGNKIVSVFIPYKTLERNKSKAYILHHNSGTPFYYDKDFMYEVDAQLNGAIINKLENIYKIFDLFSHKKAVPITSNIFNSCPKTLKAIYDFEIKLLDIVYSNEPFAKLQYDKLVSILKDGFGNNFTQSICWNEEAAENSLFELTSKYRQFDKDYNCAGVYQMHLDINFLPKPINDHPEFKSADQLFIRFSATGPWVSYIKCGGGRREIVFGEIETPRSTSEVSLYNMSWSEMCNSGIDTVEYLEILQKIFNRIFNSLKNPTNVFYYF